MDYENAFEAVKEAKKDEADVDESGTRTVGVQKYGKDGNEEDKVPFVKVQVEEIGAIKDKHNKKKKLNPILQRI